MATGSKSGTTSIYSASSFDGLNGSAKVTKYFSNASKSAGGRLSTSPSFYIRTDCTCSVALAAHGLAARRRRLLIDSTIAGVLDLRSFGPALMIGESRGMQTRATILPCRAAADVPSVASAHAVTLDVPSAADVVAATGEPNVDSRLASSGSMSSSSMSSRNFGSARSVPFAGQRNTSPHSRMGLRRTLSPLRPRLTSMQFFKLCGPLP